MIFLLNELAGCLIAVTACCCSGFLLTSFLELALTRLERGVYSFLLGAALTSVVVLLLGALHLLYAPVFVALAVATAAAAWYVSRREQIPAVEPASRLPRLPRNLFLVVYAVFAYLYLRVALLPESSPDGTRYHTALIARYLRDHALVPIYTNFYAGMPQGAESIYLIAFAFGRNTAAALVNFAVLMMLPWLVLTVFIRWKRPGAGLLASVLIFTCPMIAYTGTNAYVDTYLVAVLFGLFGLLELYTESATIGYAIAAGILAGYACAVKYTAFPALLYTASILLFSSRRNWRAITWSCFSAAILFLPWLLRNAVFYHNPFFPFANRWFPNPYMLPAAEAAYRSGLRVYSGIHSLWQLPTEYTIHGYLLQGFIGPVFLLLPLAAWALKYPFGRRLLLAAALLLYGVTQNMGTRFLMPALVFAASALALALADMGWVAVAVAAFAAFTGWPSHYNKFVDPMATRIASFPKGLPWTASERETFLMHSVGDLYESVGLLNQFVPPDGRVLSYHDLPDGYTHAEAVVSYGGALNQRLYSELRDAVTNGDREDAVEDLERNGMRFLLIRPDDRGEPVTENLVRDPAAWRMRLVAETAHYRLYEVKPKQLQTGNTHPRYIR